MISSSSIQPPNFLKEKIKKKILDFHFLLFIIIHPGILVEGRASSSRNTTVESELFLMGLGL